MLKEFRDFIAKGNVLDLAVAVIIGAAFGAIVTSLVGDILNPLIGSFGSKDLDNFTTDIHGATLKYGHFIGAIINFVIVALVMFIIVKLASSVQKKKEAAPAATPEDVVLLREIRDLLKK